MKKQEKSETSFNQRYYNKEETFPMDGERSLNTIVYIVRRITMSK